MEPVTYTLGAVAYPGLCSLLGWENLSLPLPLTSSLTERKGDQLGSSGVWNHVSWLGGSASVDSLAGRDTACVGETSDTALEGNANRKFGNKVAS